MVPRRCWFTFYPLNNEFYSSIHSDEDPETKKPIFQKNVRIMNDSADYSLNLRLSTGNYNFVGCSASMNTHFHPVSIALRPDYFPEQEI